MREAGLVLLRTVMSQQFISNSLVGPLIVHYKIIYHCRSPYFQLGALTPTNSQQPLSGSGWKNGSGTSLPALAEKYNVAVTNAFSALTYLPTDPEEAWIMT